jgi:dethiobiotin synthetase
VGVCIVTGTDTGVGKTIATAALAAAATSAGVDVAVCKPVQTGADPGPDFGAGPGDDDLREVRRLAGVTALHGSWRYPEPLAPVAAARRAGLPLPTLADLVESVRRADAPGRLTIVEGAGGLLVELGENGVTLRDLATALSAPVLVVVAPGLGTLNHTALTLESLGHQGIPCAGLVIGAWPAEPGVAEAGNRDALAGLAPLRAVLPAGAGSLSAAEFTAMSVAAVDRAWLLSLTG